MIAKQTYVVHGAWAAWKNLRYARNREKQKAREKILWRLLLAYFFFFLLLWLLLGITKVENEVLRDVLAKSCRKEKLSGMVDLVEFMTSGMTSEVMEAA